MATRNDWTRKYQSKTTDEYANIESRGRDKLSRKTRLRQNDQDRVADGRANRRTNWAINGRRDNAVTDGGTHKTDGRTDGNADQIKDGDTGRKSGRQTVRKVGRNGGRKKGRQGGRKGGRKEGREE